MGFFSDLKPGTLDTEMGVRKQRQHRHFFSFRLRCSKNLQENRKLKNKGGRKKWLR